MKLPLLITNQTSINKMKDYTRQGIHQNQAKTKQLLNNLTITSTLGRLHL